MTRRQERDDFMYITVCRHVAPSLEENVDSVVEQSNCVEMPPTNTTGGGFNEITEKRTPLWRQFGKRFWGLTAWMLEIQTK